MPFAVYLVEFIGAPRNHHALFVRSNGDDGHLFHVTGNVQTGMAYEMRKAKAPEKSASYDGMRQIGWVSSSDLGEMDAICRSNPPPAKQFNGPRRIDPRRPLRRCQEWTAETIEMLKSQGVLRPLSSGASGSSSRSTGARASSYRDQTRTSSSGTRSSSKQGPVDGERSPDGYWIWSAQYGDWYHVSKDGRTTWSGQQGSSSRRR